MVEGGLCNEEKHIVFTSKFVIPSFFAIYIRILASYHLLNPEPLFFPETERMSGVCCISGSLSHILVLIMVMAGYIFARRIFRIQPNNCFCWISGIRYPEVIKFKEPPVFSIFSESDAVRFYTGAGGFRIFTRFFYLLEK